MTLLRQSRRQRKDMPKLDRRNFQRVTIDVLGRYMLANQQEFACHIRNMSPGNIALTCPILGQPGEHVVAYLDHIGRIEGHISRLFDGGFALNLVASARKKDKLSAQLTWLANRHELNLPEDRRHNREVPKHQLITITLRDGSQHQSKILDLSLSGAALSFNQRAEIGMPIMVGKIRARIVRVFEEGVAIEFANIQDESMN